MIRFHLSCKRRNRIDSNTFTILARNFPWARRFKTVNLGRFTDFSNTRKLLSNFQQEFYFVVSLCGLCAIFRHVDRNKMAA